MLGVDNVVAGYGEVTVLKGINLTVRKGEIVSLLGANGAGKTTTLKVISGLLQPKGGRVSFNGHDITTARTNERVKMGIILVPEGRQLFPRMTVLENLELGAYTKKARTRIKETLHRVYELFPILKERKFQLAGTLSGGEQQMLAIGRGLMALPELLLLDEPSLGLAPKIVKLVMDAIDRINKVDGITVLLIEQNVYRSLQISDRAYIIENGMITLEGSGQELLNEPRVRSAYLGLSA
ncbi:MAG: ABC transporter ATP-binding protein [Aigarchaeota archaeon]|nr:ABC transporter ATP-binding protein [Aigarchaeota archaeon]MDW8092290.1 ABC transporter ATP-binding protein [Nitrososphaerota archaeon]